MSTAAPVVRSWAAAARGGRVRPLHVDDLEAVVDLHEGVLRPEAPRPHDTVREHFRRTFLDQPWADEELPSLVYESAEGDVVGFLGSNPRRMTWRDRPIRVACSSNLVVHPDHRSGAVGVLLTKSYLAGPQDVTMADCATETMRRLWTGLRGDTAMHSSIGWTVTFDPLGTAAAMGVAASSPRLGALMRRAGRVTRALPARLAAPVRLLTPAASSLVGEELTSTALAEQVGLAGRSLHLRPDYDRAHLDWLFDEIAAVDRRAQLVRQLLRTPTGRVAGWYVYLLPHRGLAQVLQVHAVTGEAEPILGHLLADAHGRGAVGVQGRVEASQASFLAARRCMLWPTAWVLVHADDPLLTAALGSPRALLSRLDGEWWIGHHLWRDE